MRRASSCGKNIQLWPRASGERRGETSLSSAMGPNELLFWLSARREGSWAQFRSAVEEILEDSNPNADNERIPLYQSLRFSLEQLGHVEFGGSERGWRVAPPVLAVSQQSNGFLGIACGARSPRLMVRLQDAASSR